MIPALLPGVTAATSRPQMRRVYAPAVRSRAALAASLALLAGAVPAAASEQHDTPVPGATAYRAALSVYLNGEDTHIVAVATRDPITGRIAVLAGDLRQLRIVLDAGLADETEVDLAAVRGLTAVFDEPAQLLRLTIEPRLLQSFAIAVAPREALEAHRVSQSMGAVLNYDVYAASAGGAGNGAYFNSTVEGRIFSSAGVLASSATISSDRVYGRTGSIVRLDTSWRRIDPAAVRSYAAGDLITGAVRWSGSYRMGGVQIQSAFSQRPDIVTAALPQFSGTAALPSSVELFVNNSRIYVGDVPPGRFTLDALPQLSGGDVRIVVRDATGNQQVVRSAYYYSPHVLRTGLFEYSAEIGLLRYGYGQRSFQYRGPAATFSGRYGLSDALTVEGHGEFARRFASLGAGVSRRVGGIAVAELAATASRFEGKSGEKVSAQLSMLIRGVTAYAGTERRFGDFFDLGRVSAVRNPTLNRQGGDAYVQFLASTLGARAFDRAGISAQLPFDRRTNISLGYTSVTSGNSGYRLLNLSASRTLGHGFALMANGYRDVRARSTALMIALTKSIGNVSATAGVQRSGRGTSFDFQASGSSGQRQNAFNWAVIDREQQGGDGYRAASLGYRARAAWFQASLQQQGGEARVVGQVTGSLVTVGGELLVVNQVGDSFVLVRNAGPDAIVRQNSVQVARTGASGSAFLPDAVPYRSLTISIDPTNMPLGWQADATEQRVVTGWRNGAIVDFGARRVFSATVRLVDAAGKPIDAGYVLKRDNGKDALIGYGGDAWLEDTAVHESGTIDLGPAGTCRVSFDVPQSVATEPLVGPIACVAVAP